MVLKYPLGSTKNAATLELHIYDDFIQGPGRFSKTLYGDLEYGMKNEPPFRFIRKMKITIEKQENKGEIRN